MKNLVEKTDLRLSRRDVLRLLGLAGVSIMAYVDLLAAAQAALCAGDSPPAVTLDNLKGEKCLLPAFLKGKVSVVHFWASWCVTCRSEITILEDLYNRYRKTAFLPCSINVGETREAAEYYLKNMHVTYPILMDYKSSVARRYGVAGVPTFFMLNRGGIIKYRIIGEIGRDEMERIVRTLL
jgi:cytochrome c biogenesis protein CcmG, thiol:disulfide interchange protein DsbE